MTEGVLLFCYNNRQVDYAKLSIISGGLAKKYLQKPVSLVTDSSTLDWMKTCGIFQKATEVFDKIIETDRPALENNRNLHDGKSVEVVPFINQNRYNAYELTPYDKTLLIDSDYFIFDNSLNEYFEVDQSVLIGERILDVFSSDRTGYLDKNISDVSINMLWATTCLFTKNSEAKLFFDLVKTVYENYSVFSHIFRFDNRQFRNDIAFSVADHILCNFTVSDKYYLPPVLSSIDRDIVYSCDVDGVKLMVDKNLSGEYFLTSVKNSNVHIMNKKSLVDFYEAMAEKL